MGNSVWLLWSQFLFLRSNDRRFSVLTRYTRIEIVGGLNTVCSSFAKRNFDEGPITVEYSITQFTRGEDSIIESENHESASASRRGARSSRSYGRVRARFFGVQVQGSASDTDTCKVTECANTVIIAAYRCSCFLIVGR